MRIQEAAELSKLVVESIIGRSLMVSPTEVVLYGKQGRRIKTDLVDIGSAVRFTVESLGSGEVSEEFVFDALENPGVLIRAAQFTDSRVVEKAPANWQPTVQFREISMARQIVGNHPSHLPVAFGAYDEL